MWKARLSFVLVACVGCSGGTTPTSSSPQPISVAGTWDGQFSGTVQAAGTSQTDSFVGDLTQVGSAVRGTLRYSGTTIPLPITGSVEGNTFTYNGNVNLAPNCEVTVRAETTINGVRFSGQQTQSTCKGTAVGQVTATRR